MISMKLMIQVKVLVIIPISIYINKKMNWNNISKKIMSNKYFY